MRSYYYDTNPLDPTGHFSQNAVGRLTAIKYSVGPTNVQVNEVYSYYAPDLVAAKRLQINEPYSYIHESQQKESTTLKANLDTSFGYNGEGALAEITYPSTMAYNGAVTAGPTYYYSFDNMLRLSGMTDSNNNTIVNGVSYDAANRLLTMQYVQGWPETRSYNVLGQLVSLTIPYQNQYHAWVPRTYTYSYPTGSDNGKISSMYNPISGETVSYTYDSLNRLSTAISSAGWGEQYGFDAFGNLLSKAVTAGSGPSLSQAVNPANNQIVGQSYDANGNTLTVATSGNTYNVYYDLWNRLAQVNNGSQMIMEYGYDGQNHRIWNWSGATDTFGNANNYTLTVYSPSGQNLGSYTFTPILYGPPGGGITPVLEVSGGLNGLYFGNRLAGPIDRLGSANGTYYPWGENEGSTNPQNEWSFATYWSDSLTGLDYAQNRYYSNAYGRFMTPDPSTDGQDLEFPQSWNLYPYVIGDLVNLSDPTGLFIQCSPPSVPSSDGSTCVFPIPGTGSPLPGGSGGTGGQTPQQQKAMKSEPAPCPAGTFRPYQNSGCIPSAGYWGYVSCFVTGVLTQEINDPEITGVSVWAMGPRCRCSWWSRDDGGSLGCREHDRNSVRQVHWVYALDTTEVKCNHREH